MSELLLTKFLAIRDYCNGSVDQGVLYAMIQGFNILYKRASDSEHGEYHYMVTQDNSSHPKKI